MTDPGDDPDPLDHAFEHETVLIRGVPAAGLTAVIAVHSTVLGPAEGGLRVRAYPGVRAAMLDALVLSAAMTLKTSAAGLPLGGGKAVLTAHPSPAARRSVMHAVGDIVNELEGRYIVAEDVGTTPQDMDWIAERTEWVAGLSVERGGLGDPSPATARTVLGAVRHALALLDGERGLAGATVGVLGVGKVGARLTELLVDAGAVVTVADLDAGRARACAEQTGAELVGVDGFLQRSFDVLAPCGGGQVIDSVGVGRLRCRVVAGAANNQLADEGAAGALHDAGILYVPDFIANCGGVIFNAAEYFERTTAELEADLGDAVDRIGTVLDAARAQAVAPLLVARRLAQERIQAAGSPPAGHPHRGATP